MAKLFVLPFFLFSLFSYAALDDTKDFCLLGSQAKEALSTAQKRVEISLKFNKKEFHHLYNHFELKCTDLKTKRSDTLNLFYVEFPTKVSFQGDRFVVKSVKKGKSYFVNTDDCSLERVYFDD